MAKNNEVMARVRVTIGGVEASKKNLDTLQTSAEQLKLRIKDLNKQKVELVNKNDIKGADAVVKELNKLGSSFRNLRQLIKAQEQELNNYTNILDDLSNTRLVHLQKGLRDLQQQMKLTLTMNDVERYKELKEAYDELLDSVNQLSGKAPNLNYVLSNLGNVASKTLKDSVDYVKRMISETDKGSTRLVTLQNQLASLQTEQQSRLKDSADTAMGKVNGVSFAGTEAEAKQAIETLREYKATLNMEAEADEILKVQTAMDAYEKALGKVKDTAIDVSEVLENPKNFSVGEIDKAIKQLEEDGKKIVVGDSDAIQKNLADIEKLKAVLAESVHSESFIDNVIKDAKEGTASIDNMEKAIGMIKDKLRRSTNATVTEKLRQDLDTLTPKLELTKTSLSRVTETLKNVKGANLGSLKEAAERLKVEINDVNIKMDDFAEKAAQLKQVNAQIKELEAQTKNVSSAWDNAISRLKNWVLVYAGSAKIWDKLVESYQGSLRLSDTMTDVQKTTGLAAEEVVNLTNQIQELDTRISNEDLMKSAVEAGRIGLKTREEVLQFTKASAITLTALDELDARSITSVMKLNTLLGETARLGVQQAILSTASSINELSMASSAAQQPIIDFSRRFGGIAAQANISTAEVLGLGATIDALGQPIEMSSTALNKFTTALLTNGKAIAADTGLSEDYIFEMTRKGKTIELMVEVLSKLNSLGGIGEISKYMGDMGGEGTRMTAVISALAANIGFLRENLDLSQLSFEEGISVINEYNLKNENAAAIVARMGNTLKELFVNSTAVQILTGMLRGLYNLIQFMSSGTAAATAFNAVMGLVIVRIMALNKWVRGLNDTLILTWKYMRQGQAQTAVWPSLLTAVTTGFKALGTAIKSVFASNPLGWLVVGVSLLTDWIWGMESAEEQTDATKTATQRANEAFEEEAYKLNKLREKLDAAKNGMGGLSEVISALNRDYGKQIGYVLDLAASYDEVTAAIELATIAKRKQMLEEEKAKVGQNVREEYRPKTTDASNELKKALSQSVGVRKMGNEWDFFNEKALSDLYNAILLDVTESARIEGQAKLGKRVTEAVRTNAKTMMDKGWGQDLESLVKLWTERIGKLDAVENLLDTYTGMAKEIARQEGDINRVIAVESTVYTEQIRKNIETIIKSNSFIGKAAKDFNADDESALQQVVDSYDNLINSLMKANDTDGLEKAKEEQKKYKAMQRDVLLAFIDNPLRGIKMKVGDDGKLYKEVAKNGKLQYEAVQKLDDANLDMLRKTFIRAGKIYDQLVSDNNSKIDSKVMEQAKHLSKVRTDIKKHFAKYGQDIDEEGNLKPRNTEYTDHSAKEADKEAKAAYKVLLQNMEEYYENRKQILLKKLLAEGKTIKEKNLELKKWEVEYRQSLANMQYELLGRGEVFDENVFIRDIEQYKKAAALARDASKTFQDQVARDMEKNESKILDLQFLPATRGGSDAEKVIRKAYTAILKNIEEFYAKQKAIVETDYLNSSVTVEEKNRRIEELDLRHWQARIAMQREVLGELGENGEKMDWFNESYYVRDLENYKFVVDHMLDESHHYQDTVRADMENAVLMQEALLSKHKKKVDEILLGNNYRAQVDKEMQEQFEIAGLFWGETQERSAKNAVVITDALREAAKDAYAIEADEYIERLKINEVFGNNVQAMTREQQEALIILLQEYHDKTIEADKRFADQRRKLTEQLWKGGGYENQYENAMQSISQRKESVDTSKVFGAMSDREAYDEQYQLTLEQWALEEWRYNMQYELAVKAGETEEQLLARRMEMAEMEKQMQQQVTEAYLQEYNRRAEKASEHAKKFGEFAGVMASSAWNTVEDRKKAGEALLKYIAEETTEYIRELLIRKVKEEVLRRQGLIELKKSEEQKTSIEQKGMDASIEITEIGGKIKTAVEENIAGSVASTAESAAAQSASTAVAKAQVDSAAGMASGAAKTIGELGWWGIPLIAAIEGVLSMLLSMAVGALSSTFGSSSKSTSSKRLATGMLTYAEGRYPVQGVDGVTYNAQYEPSLQTKVYDGGRNKAHMAVFSEVMPEMVISGPTTKLISEDYPGLMQAIMMIDKYGTLPQLRRIRTYASGNVGEFSDMVPDSEGVYTESPAMTELRQSNAELRDTVARLASVLEKGISANINMYGAGGIKESVDKANKFYAKNRIKNS